MTRAIFLAALALLALPTTWAARPMITDDARIVDAKACQVESWARRAADATELWTVPACNPFGNAELSLGGARTREHGASRFSEQIVQAKTLFRPYEPGSWGVGLAVGTLRHPAGGKGARRWPGDAYAYLPYSIALGSDDVVLHVNSGAARHRGEGRTVGTWGVGSEVRLSASTYFIPEVFATGSGRPFYQAGVRHWVVPDRVQVDATFGNRLVSDRSERWFSIGMRLLSPPFLP